MEIARMHHELIGTLIEKGANHRFEALRDIPPQWKEPYLGRVISERAEMIRHWNIGIGPDTLQAIGWYAGGVAQNLASRVGCIS
jgi:hypothetical protein